MFDHSKYRPFPAIKMQNRQWPQQQITQAPQWCSVDLRDGNQALIEPMSVKQKQKMWQLLINMGFKQIEVGFPSASQIDFDFVRWLIEENKIPTDVSIQVLVQARGNLIERTFESLIGAKQAIVHIYNSTSPTQREKVFNLDKAGITHIAVQGAKKIQSESLKYPNTKWTFEYSPESFSSTEIEFSTHICNAVLEVWKPNEANKVILNLPATVECAGPNVFADQVETFCKNIKDRKSVIISVHTHNDRGCAVAAAELALLAGADRVEGTLMGNGERTGNMDIITMAMNLYSQGINPELDLSNPAHISNTVQSCTNIPTHPRHPWVGELVYTAFSGSHQDAIKKCLNIQQENQNWDVAYLPINPKDIGRDYQSVIRINSQSGKGGVAYILENEFGINMPRWMQIEMSQAVQEFSENQQSEVSAQDIHNIFQSRFMNTPGPHTLEDYHLHKSQQGTEGSQEVIQAFLTSSNGTLEINGEGNGSIEAFCHAIERRFNVKADIVQYTLLTQGQHTDADAIAYIQININQSNFTVAARQRDSLSASVSAILNGLNRYLNTAN